MIYCYNLNTGEYAMTMPFETETGEGRTDIQPPEIEAGEVAVFDIEAQSWSVYPDYRFTHKMELDGVIYQIENFGDIPDGYTLLTNEQAGEIEEKIRIANLCLTAADVERAIYKVKNIDFDDVIEFVETSGVDIDIKALKIELKANNFYRGNSYIDQIGALLGFTGEQLDNFFRTGDYTALMVE